MLLQLGVTLREDYLPFQPEAGAYGGGHRHGHDSAFAEKYARAQQLFYEYHGHECSTTKDIDISIRTMTFAATSIRKLIALLRLASTAPPIGTFSYSQGLEGAVDAQLVHDAEMRKPGYGVARSMFLRSIN